LICHILSIKRVRVELPKFIRTQFSGAEAASCKHNQRLETSEEG